MKPLVLLLVLCGCTLIDQNTFNPRARDAPVAPPAPVVAVAPVVPGPPPLVVIGPTATGYADVLIKAVASAKARKAGVVFDVVEVQKPDAAADATLGANAVAVARLIVGQGVPPDRVRLVARPEVGGVAGEVRVFVR